MRAVTMGILALMCGGCAAAPAFDLVPRDPEAPWMADQGWIRTESSRATVNASFDRTWLDHIIFEVEIVNQSDSMLVVDPEGFSYRLSSAGDDLPAKLKGSFAAVAPAAVVAQLDKEIARASDASFAVIGLSVLVVVAAFALNRVEPAPAPQAELADQRSSGSAGIALHEGDSHEGDVRETRMSDPRRARELCLQALLPRTTLAPGAIVRGELWMPVWPLRKAVGSGSPESSWSITAAPAHAPADCGLTLRTPAALGGQGIEYSVTAW